MFFSKKINQFFAVAINQSLVKAEEKINVTPSALRHGINELEKKLGNSLVKRTKEGMILTPAGKKLYENLYPYYEKIKKIENQLIDNYTEKDTLSIKLDGLYYPDLKTKLLAIKKEHSQYRLALTDGFVDNLEKELFDEEFDLVISSLDFSYTTQNIQAITLCTQKIGLLVNKHVFERYADKKTFFANETLVQRNSALQNPIFSNIFNKLKKSGYQYHTLGLTDMADVLHYIEKGAGYCFLPNNFDYISTITNDKVKFISSPFCSDIFVHQKVYFKQDNNKNLLNIAMTLR